MSTKFTDEHVWIRPDAADPQLATVGITEHAQETLGDIVFVELPEIGKTLDSKAVGGVVESVKAAADVFMPAGGTVVAVNEALRADPALANSDPLGEGWFFRVRLGNSAELDALMDETAYAAFSANA